MRSGDWEGALTYYHDAIAAGLHTEDLFYRIITKLETLLIENNQPLPWPVSFKSFSVWELMVLALYHSGPTVQLVSNSDLYYSVRKVTHV